MDTHHRNNVLRLLGSVKLAAVLLVALAIATAVATLLESANGTAYAQTVVYRARWFEAILVLFAINMITMFFLRWPFRRTQTGFMITHLSVIVILIGAGMTRFMGYEGVMRIREGSSADFIYSREDHVSLSVADDTAHAEINLYKPGSQNIRNVLEVGDERFDVTLTEYWPHVDRRLEEGEGGQPTLELTTATHGAPERLAVEPGDSHLIGTTRVHFLGVAALPSGDETPARGAVRAALAGETRDFVVPDALPAEFVIAGQRIRVTEFNPNFTVGGTVDPTAPMRNPALRLEIESTDGQQFSRQVFALHPHFTVGDSLAGSVGDLELEYAWSPNLYLVMGEDGIVRGAADCPTQLTPAGAAADADSEELAAGVPFSLARGSTVWANGAGIRLDRSWSSAVWVRGPADDENAPAGANVEIVDANGNRAEKFVLLGGTEEAVRLGDREVGLAVGPIRIPVDYQIHLDDFVLVNYPGSDNPASYESHVRVYDPERGVEGKPVRIYMNHPLTYRGFKHFQSSYDRDQRGTILSVNKDPGTLPTYIGYFLMTLGFLITLTRGLVWNRMPAAAHVPHGMPATKKAASKVSSASKRAAALSVLLFLVTGSLVDHASAQGHDHSGVPAPFLSDDTREVARYLVVQDYQGRMKPLDTFAREMIVKITKRAHFEGWDPVDLYLSWIAQPRYWFNRPVISVRNEGVKHILRVGPNVKRVAASSLFNPQGGYLIQDEVELARRTPDRDRSKTQRKLLSFDDRVNLFLLSVQGQTLKIFPVPEHPNDSWLGVDVFSELGPEHREEFQSVYGQLTEAVAHADDASVATAIPALRGLQSRYGADVFPSDSRIRSEIWLNSINPFVRVMALYGLALVVLGVAYVWGLAKRDDPHYPLRQPLFATGMAIYTIAVLFHTFGYILRWTASSHAPLSNGYESLIFISLATGVSGMWYEFRDRRGSSAGLSSMLVLVILGVAMLPTFDPAISPIVPVLASYWLIIHVTVITASYALLGLAATMGMTMLILHLFKRPGADRIRRAVNEMNGLLFRVLVAGLALLSVGTLLGGVWANESWGRYWGWDPKETWALVTILVYATVVHFRYIPALNRPWVMAAASFTAISSVIMTYLGVNYLLSGLHSYGSGEAAGLPSWAYYTALFMAILVTASYVAEKKYEWFFPHERHAQRAGTKRVHAHS